MFSSALSPSSSLVSRRWVSVVPLVVLLPSLLLCHLVVISSGESFPLNLPIVELFLLSLMSILFRRVNEKDELW